ncbi:M10 family metallopeptidase C-terminal domain-containing protein [Phaeobacter sp. HF9A]|uniref:M10 family metallopeptidase C-terminal domain-containing protein n=1 Tax=Phaeobacter sp. HF9A TaxID=2721561 RepID=UPI001432195B|nr:M10 family metallopeptidase C-terminal domain-containing protein [Phaeobacter sp. HF9A]NIZ15643.1 matrixin family metalloprotease [Phaeobacter sp. HF9A]
MCFLCTATQTFDPLRHGLDGIGDFATIHETNDAPVSISTGYSMSVGDRFNGTIESSGDSDWIAITLIAGQSYEINLTASPSGDGTLQDPFLSLYNGNGIQITYNDDGGGGLEARLAYTPSSSGSYYVSASGFDAQTGSYTLSVTEGQPSEAADLDALASFLTEGYWNASGQSTRSFNTSASNQLSVNITGLTAAGQQLARWAFQAWERVANLDFEETSSSSADIVFDDNKSGAYAYSVTSGNTVLSSEVNIETSWISSYGETINSYALQTYIHEIGHALGLGHQGDYNGNARYGTDQTFDNDSWQVSVMSYFSQSDNTTINASYAYVVTAMMADIAAIQRLYGAPDVGRSETAGNTTWGANTTLTSSYFADVFAVLDGRSSSNITANGDLALTIYDVSGTDLIDLSNNTSHDRIDLNAESYSDIAGLIGNVAIARGTVIENLIAGSGNDTITGNEVSNRLSGALGNDVIAAGAGADTVWGAEGDDSIDGGEGADSLIGQNGRDTLFGASSTDILRGDDGNDSLVGGTGDDTLYGGVGNDTLLGNTALDTIYGNAGNDYISSGDGVDYVDGGEGNDTIYGRSGWDSLYGGSGDDRMYGSEGDDLLVGNGGNDWISAGSAWDVVFGNDGNDTLYGNYGSDVISGGDGEDLLYGGTGDDTLRGLSGNDTLYGNQGVDRLEGGSGNDLLRGGTLRDTFVFDVGHDIDEINDFELHHDRLELSSALVDGLRSGQEVLNSFVSVTGGFVVFDFGGGDQITLSNLTTTDELDNSIFIM